MESQGNDNNNDDGNIGGGSGRKGKNRSMMVTAGVMAAVLATAAVFMTQPALAQLGTNSTQPNGNATNNNNSSNPQAMASGAMPQLKGSINLRDAAKAFLSDNVKVPFSTALTTAQGAVSNGTVIGGRLAVAQGYLAYAFKVANFDAGTSRMVMVDAGNGSVLYASGDMPLHFGGGFGGHGYGCARGHFGPHGMMNWSGKAPMMSPPPSTTTSPQSSSLGGSGVSPLETTNA